MTDTEKQVRKQISDLGIAAWLNMHGYKFVGKKGRTVYFDIKETEVKEFEKLYFEYFDSLCSKFDMCLLNIKKFGEYAPPENLNV
jgi:hypothetical protein